MGLKSRGQRVQRKAWSVISRTLELIFFNATLKLFALRLVLLASLVNLAIQVDFVTRLVDKKFVGVLLLVVPLISIFLHHVASVFILRFVPQWLDLLLAAGEIIYLCTPTTTPFVFFTPLSLYNPSLNVWGMTTLVCIASTLAYLFFCRIGAIVRHHGSHLAKPFDFLEDRPQARCSFNELPGKYLPRELSLLLGRSLWRRQFIGETSYMRMLRGLVAGGLVITIAGYGLMSIVVEPTLESAFIPTKKTRTGIYNYPKWGVDSSGTWEDLFSGATWSFYFAVMGGDQPIEALQEAINVTVSYRRAPRILAFDIGIDYLPNALCQNQAIWINSDLGVKARCPHTFYGETDITSNIFPGTWAQNDALISIDFSLLNQSMFGASGAIAVYPSLTENIDASTMFRDIVPFPLLPGVSYFATISVRGRQAFAGRSQATSSFGIFGSPDSYLVPSIRYVVPDPLARHSQSSSSNISTLRLSCEFDTAEFRVETDQRDKTVFAGFATVGGLFTFVSGMFTFVFGTTLLRILFDMKQLSVFGLVQRWERKRIVEAYLDKYPLLRAELELDSSQGGIVAVLQDHLLDMKLFREVLEAKKESAGSGIVANIDDEEDRTSVQDPRETHEVEEGTRFLSNSNGQR